MGLNIINAFLFIGSFIILAIAGGFATDASRRLQKSADPDLKSAHSYLTYAAILCWISIAAILIGGGLYLFFFSETIEETGNWVVYGFLFLTLILVGAVGILAAIAATKIGKSKADNNGAYRQTIIAAVLGIVGFVMVLTIIGIKFFYKAKGKESVFDKNIPNWAANEIASEPELGAVLG